MWDADTDLDLLIETSTVAAQLADGAKPQVVAARSSLGARGVLLANREQHANLHGKVPPPIRSNATRWTKEEDAFVRQWVGFLSFEEIANALGRSVPAVHIRIVRVLRIPMPSKDPRWMTLHQLMRALGVPDIHAPMLWVKRGLLHARELPFVGRRTLVVERVHMLMFVTNPLNWIYFDPRRVQDPYLKRLVTLRAARWNDEWWTPGQVERYHGIRNAHKQISARAKAQNGAARWGNYRILKSVAVQLKFWKGKGDAQVCEYSPAANAFLVLARAVGVTAQQTAALLSRNYGFPRSRIHTRRVRPRPLDPDMISYRIRMMRESGQLDRLLAQHRLRVVVGARGEDIFADWKYYRTRFPFVARAMDAFAKALHGERVHMRYAQMLAVRSVFARWAEHFAGTSTVVRATGGLSLNFLYRAYQRLLRRGIDPYKEGYMQIRTETVVSFHPALSLAEARALAQGDPDALATFQRELRAAMQAAGIEAFAKRGPKSRRKIKIKASERKRKGELLACDYCDRTDLNGPHGKATHISKAHPEKVAQRTASSKKNGHVISTAPLETVPA